MSDQRIILEVGMGNDLYGQDYTKAACRAVEDALRHSSITLFGTLGIDHMEMRVQVTVAVAEPDLVDLDVVRARLPRGRAEVSAVKGGLNVVSGDQTHVVAQAAVEAFLPSMSDQYRLSVV